MHERNERVDAFVQALYTAADRDKKPLVRLTHFTLPPSAEDPVEHDIVSWKAQEFAYRQFSQDPDDLPTLARGLFTERMRDEVGEYERILIRGYDKFFNQGELPWTKPEVISTFSTGPYVLSFKENGCIIFLSAVTPKRLLVTSKHSLGLEFEEDKPSHAEMGRSWVQRHLAKCQRTEEDLAAELWDRDETAVLELCDDSFEEHVLPYPPERTGLHLHGLNKNSIDFMTRPMEEVNAFAKSWGFIPVRFLTFDTYAEVEAFAKEVAATGSLHDEPIEGFVVRTSMPSEMPSCPDGMVAPPYHACQTWFYKIKFDEPYLMYRDWRELTRTMLRDKSHWDAAQIVALRSAARNMNVNDQESQDHEAEKDEEQDKETAPQANETSLLNAPSKNALKRAKAKLKREMKRKDDAKAAADRAAGLSQPYPPTPRSRRPETLLYIQWCYDRLYGNSDKNIIPEPALFAHFNEGRGIIALRDHFLAYKASEQGQMALQSLALCRTPQTRDLRQDDRPYEKTLIVPMAVPGCGKTAICVALRHLFGWAHTQSDDVQTKRTGPGFLKNVEKELLAHNVVLADRNNHLLKHRNEMVDIVRRLSEPEKGKTGRIRLCALVWRINGLPHSEIQQVCANRIVERGDRHQCLRIETPGHFQYDTILTRFIKEGEPFQGAQSGEGSFGVADDQFDEAVWLDIHKSMREILEQILHHLCPIMDVSMPSDPQISEALEVACTYQPSVRKPLPKMEAENDPLAVHPSSYLGVFFPVKAHMLTKQVLEKAATNELSTSARSMLENIEARNRVIQDPHITLIHRQDVESGKTDQDTWDNLFKFATKHKGLHPSVDVKLSALLWNERVMAFEVGAMYCGEWGSDKPLGFREKHHVTVGTAAKGINPFEANELWNEHALAQRIDIDMVPMEGFLIFKSNPR